MSAKIIRSDYHEKCVIQFFDNGTTITKWASGTIEKKMNGLLHCEDGPAINWGNGIIAWYLHGKKHRLDGPAVESGSEKKEYYINGKHYSFEEWDRVRKLHSLL